MTEPPKIDPCPTCGAAVDTVVSTAPESRRHLALPCQHGVYVTMWPDRVELLARDEWRP
jgi:hypothetical protein